MEQEARPERIEAAHETLLKAVTGLAAVQAKQGENLETIVGIIGDIAIAQDKTGQTLLILAAAQARTEQQMALLATAQANTEQQRSLLAAAQTGTEQQMTRLAADHQDTTAGLHLLDRFVDNWIREHGAKNGKSNPDPPPAA